MMQSLLLVAALVTAELDVVIVQNKEPKLVGKTSLELNVQTTFGSAVVDEDNLDSIQIGKQRDVLTSTDGTVLRGTKFVDVVTLRVGEKVRKIPRDSIKSLHVIRRAMPKPGEITNGTAANQMTYHLRVPHDFQPETPRPAIVILHGSNTSSKPYLDTIVSTWPRIAKQYILIGINGERRSARSTPDAPAFNYSYVSFTGKSKFKGYPGTDRQSPALVAEVLTELKKELPIDKVFVGGHSQGGYLTYMVMMNFPKLIDGAFPISGGMIFQAEPRAFVDEAVRKQQRRVPLAIVHGKTDPQVAYSMARDAHTCFIDDAFPTVRLFSHQRAGHGFMLLPVDDAIDWLAKMSSDDAAKLVTFAEEQWATKRYRDAVAALNRAKKADESGALKDRIDALEQQIEAHVADDAERFVTLIRENQDGTWIESFLEFRDAFAFTGAAKKAITEFQELRRHHEEPAANCYADARKAFKQRKKDEGFAKYQEVIDKYYASSWYSRMKRWVDERKE